jgi:hypothetical protein
MADDDFEAEERERERRRRIIDQSRETVRRLKDIEMKREEVASPELARRPVLRPACSDDAVERWRAQGEAFAAECEAAKAELASASKLRPFDWSAIDERIAAAIEHERQLVAEIVGESIAQLLAEARKDTMKAMREELRELRLETARLNSESVELRRAIALERGTTIDLPSPLRSNIN